MIYAEQNQGRNHVINRFLPMPESVAKGLESEPKFEDFQVLKELGSGSFGHVILVQHKITQAKYAIKAIDKRNATNIQEMPYFIREIEIMYRVHHPNVVKLFGHFEDNNYCYFIMEYIPRGNIYSLVQREGFRTVTLQEIASIMKDVISAVYFLHHMHPKIVHRDIKPENVLLDNNNHAKLTDFGWSNYMEGGIKRTTVCGTPVYLAPEIITNRGHDEHVDIWCIGVLLFELIAGYAPFSGDNEQNIRYNIAKMKINWPSNMDTDAADLISRILKYNPEERISLEQMLIHPFFKKFFPNAISCLIKPDRSIQYKVFIVSKDNPLTWNPIYNNNPEHSLNIKPNQIENNNNSYSLNQYNYDALYQKYKNLKKEYNDLKKAGFSSTSLESLRRELKEKENKINQILSGDNNNKINNINNNININNNNQTYNQSNTYQTENVSYTTSYDYQNIGNNFNNNINNINKYKNNNNDLRVTYDDLIYQNYDLKNKLNQYENHFNQNNAIYLDNNFNQIRNSITTNNKVEFNQAFDKLKNDIDIYTQNNYNTIISMKDREIENWKKEEKLRKEREDQEIKALIQAYDTSLSMGERENAELKMKLKELEGYF